MKTLFTLIRLIFGLIFSIALISIFVFLEVYVIDIVDQILIERGIVGEFMGFTYSQLLWGFTFVFIALEIAVFLFKTVWRTFIGGLKDLFSLS